MDMVAETATADNTTPEQIAELVRAGYEVRRGGKFKRVMPVGEYQLFNCAGILVRPLPYKATRQYLEAAGWPTLRKGVIR